ncbi:BspA family leucine-rich repeat surface protein [uncultured Flavobacterium sp.]|uniref:BspA family leucine-rich repeat surface protein n=1 Tax=uncultured Flavobacterium sp. TaxID=165435 RepID=UPI0025EF0B4A|nr:BspA family leucine-rich repeat surface protein [uncultured Flavobacterium sp.]
MKKLYVLFVLMCFGGIYGQEPFITTWETTLNNSITIPIQSGPGVNYTIDFGNGTILTNRTGPTTYLYVTPGLHTITISGNYGQIKFGDGNNSAGQLRSIEQWGDAQWTSMEEAFKNCSLMIINATDVPDLSQVTTMKEMFSHTNFDQSINDWDVSSVTNMYGLFDQSSYNQPLDNWNVSNVTTMAYMFRYSQFNQPLAAWDVSNVTSMEFMFFANMVFNQPINDWDVSNVTSMANMFNQAFAFNQPINGWNVSSVTNMMNMFLSANAFNQPLDNWDVSNVTVMEGMFYSSQHFNQPLNAWDVSAVVTMKNMFRGSSLFNMPLDNWDLSSASSLEGMFSLTGVFNQPLEGWDVSNVENMSFMFKSSDAFNQPLNNWDVSNVTNMALMFNLSVFDQPLDNWDVSGVTNMSDMFSHTVNFDQDLSSWEFNNGVFLHNLVNFAGSLSVENYDALLLAFVRSGLENRQFTAYGLEYCNAAVRNYLINQLNWQIMSDVWNGACIPNAISGNVFFDEAADGCDANDVALSHAFVNVHNDDFSYIVPVSPEGNYSVDVSQGNFTIEILNLPQYFNPASYTIEFDGFGDQVEQDICITQDEAAQDLNVILLPVSEARPGFAAQYQLVITNAGSQVIDAANVTVSFDNTLQSFVSANPAPVAANTAQLDFILNDMQLFESRAINFTTQFFTPPTVNSGDIASFSVNAIPDGTEQTPDDNTYVLLQEIINSYDPNDKQVLQGSEISPEQAEGYLDYLVRFQNTGTASAITVRIEDHLPENVDWTTLTPISASHNYRIEVKEDHTAEFIFDNINLPHEAANEPGSHGFIAYRIKPLPTVAVGDVITGNAEIFFDYNLPIITNFATTTIVEAMNAGEHSTNIVSIYPNPVTDVLHLNASNGALIEEVKVYNLQGRELMSFTKAGSINVAHLSSGVYVLMVTTNAGISKQKLIRK